MANVVSITTATMPSHESTAKNVMASTKVQNDSPSMGLESGTATGNFEKSQVENESNKCAAEFKGRNQQSVSTRNNEGSSKLYHGGGSGQEITAREIADARGIAVDKSRPTNFFHAKGGAAVSPEQRRHTNEEKLDHIAEDRKEVSRNMPKKRGEHQQIVPPKKICEVHKQPAESYCSDTNQEGSQEETCDSPSPWSTDEEMSQRQEQEWTTVQKKNRKKDWLQSREKSWNQKKDKAAGTAQRKSLHSKKNKTGTNFILLNEISPEKESKAMVIADFPQEGEFAKPIQIAYPKGYVTPVRNPRDQHKNQKDEYGVLNTEDEQEFSESEGEESEEYNINHHTKTYGPIVYTKSYKKEKWKSYKSS